jgi:hypothetical protein
MAISQTPNAMKPNVMRRIAKMTKNFGYLAFIKTKTIIRINKAKLKAAMTRRIF